MFRTLFFTTLLLMFTFQGLQAQQQGSFQRANALLQQGEYEQAVEIYRQLLQQNPENIPAIDRKATALVSLKKYEEAINLITRFTERNPGYPNLSVRVGEIYHMDGRRDEAYSWWEQMIERDERNVQVYRLVAESMVNRREHEKAALLYRRAREVMQNDQMFGFDIAQNFTAAGNYEEAMREYSHLLSVNPGFLNAIQRQLARYEDEFFKDTAIMEFEEASRSLRTGSDSWVSHREMLIWLYTERELYRRALVTATNLEDRAGENNFAVYSLARRLANMNQFELAEEAFRRYADDRRHDLYADSRLALANLYIRHARYLDEHNLDFGTRAERLHEEAYSMLSELYENRPDNRLTEQVLVMLTELSIDYLQDGERAELWLGKFEDQRRYDEIIRDYLQGRVYLFKRDFTRARLNFSRANRAAGTGEMAERTRYFLSLAEFLAGEFEFATLQIRSLGRQTTSYYANDALRLRGVLQEGMLRDSVSAELKMYTEAMHSHRSGKSAEALSGLEHFMDFSSVKPLHSQALLMAGDIIKKYRPELAFGIFDAALGSGQTFPGSERLVWERARIADAMLSGSAGGGDEESGFPADTLDRIHAKIIGQATGGTYSEAANSGDSLRDRITTAEAIRLYEDLIVTYPNGFYASAARERIRTLQQSAHLIIQ